MPMRLPRGIHQRAAGVARVDRGVGLDEVLEAVDAEMVAPERADDAERHGVAETERVADGEHEVAHAHALEATERDRRQVVALGLEHGEVRLRIGAAHARLQPAAILQHELDVVRALDHVMVGEDVAVARHEDAGAEARRALARHALVEVREVAAQERIVEQRVALPHLLAGVDVHDGRHGLAHGVGEGRHLRAHRPVWPSPAAARRSPAAGPRRRRAAAGRVAASRRRTARRGSGCRPARTAARICGARG